MLFLNKYFCGHLSTDTLIHKDIQIHRDTSQTNVTMRES